MAELRRAGDALVTAPVGFDDPEAYISRDRRRALALGIEPLDRVRGAALFADISGFTSLTEALASELGAQRGAEELTANLNRVFHAIIDELHRFDGDVIYFSGDAVTCWLDGDDGARAVAAAVAMQDAMARAGEIVTPGGTTVTLAMKVAVAVGAARRFVVGDPEIQLIEVLAGRLVDELAAAEHLTEPGEILLDESALATLADRVEIAEMRVDDETGRSAGVVVGLSDPPEPAAPEPEPPLPDELVRPWLLPAVYDRMRTGRGEFLAELRPAIPVFVRFSGIDYDADDDAIGKLDDFIRRAQRTFSAYGGNLLQLTLGDKGAYLYAVFGSPHAHENDAARAVAAATELLELDQVTAARELQIGIAHGRLRSGTYGHAMRRTFVCLGDAVNLSARLMSKAPPGQVYASEAVRTLAGDAFAWERLPDMTVKGKAEPIVVYALSGGTRDAGRRQTRYALPIVGRAQEIAALEAVLERTREGHGHVVGLAAEAGVGKSRLLAEFVRRVRRRGIDVAFGECQAFGTRTSYVVWSEIWRTLFRVDPDVSESEQVRTLEDELATIDPALVPRAPLLDVLLGISIPDNELTGSFDAELRKTSLEALLADCLRARTAGDPLVLVLEDCHWIDPLSRELLEVVARAAESRPVLVLLAYRPATEPGGALGLERLPQFSEIALAELEPHEAEQLIRSKLAHVLGEATEPPRVLVDLVTTRSQGNPFYIEELLSYIEGQGVDLRDENALRDLQLPESLHTLILSRVDTLAEAPRRTLKVASVVGRTFHAPALPGIYPELGSIADVRGHLHTLRSLDLVKLDRPAEEEYIFKHVVTQEVAYESMPFAIRADLHERAGGFIEESEPDAIDRHLDLLAHHYWHSENVPKKREFLVRAGEAAQANYANAAAIDYFERAVPLLDGADRWRVTRELGAVLEVTGDWPAAERAYRDALALADEAGDASAAAWTDTFLADLARKRGDYDDASNWVEKAQTGFDALGDDVGLGRVLQIAGTVAATQGDFETARRDLEASLTIRRELGDEAAMGALLSNLGVMAEYEGDYERSRALHEEGLALRESVGDKGAIAISRMNLGNVLLLLGHVDEALACQEESLRLRRETGDPWMIALGEHNLGILTRSQGDLDATRELFAGALVVYREHGEKWALAFMLEDVAVVATLVGEAGLALRLAGAGAALRDEIGAPRGQADQEEFDVQLAPAREALGGRADEIWEGGRQLQLDEALGLALAFCEREEPKV
jgi:class 3 adenylate cyclase/tetratricopeptide (TPR) repeat protein